MEIQLEGYVALDNIKPKIQNGAIYFPRSVKHVDLDEYEGDARSFGYNFDDGRCTVVSYEVAVGALADDTVALFDECVSIKKHLKKPTQSLLEFDDDSKIECDPKNSELLIRYDSDYFYKDENGYWFKSDEYSASDSTDYSIAPVRVTEESAELYREVNAEYQRSVVIYNDLMREALDNMQLLSEFDDE